MLVRCKNRFKDGNEHRYWSAVENVRVRGGRVVQRQVLHLGEIDDSQRAVWCHSIEVVEGKSGSRQMALFPEDLEAPALDREVVKIDLAEVSMHDPRQWGRADWPSPCGSAWIWTASGVRACRRAGKARGGWTSLRYWSAIN